MTAVDEPRIAELRASDDFFWIDLVSPDDESIEALGRALGLHPVALEDTREFGQRPKLDPYGDHVLLVFYSARTTGDEAWPAEPLESHIYLSGGFMATIRRDPCSAIDELHSELAREGTRDEEILIYRVLDALAEAYYPALEALEESIDALEGEVLSHPRREHLTRSYRLKQCVHQLHRLVAAQHDQALRSAEVILGLRGLERGSRPYLRDIGDHLVQVAGELQRQLDDLTALTQTYFNANADRLNAATTRLTIGGTIFLICSLVTGFFGQNFGWLVDNIDSRTDFLIYGVGSLLVPTVALLTLFWFKRRDWF